MSSINKWRGLPAEQIAANFLTMVEGTKLQMYHDTSGLPTIGTGHLLTKSELSSGKLQIGGSSVNWGAGISEHVANLLLLQDMSTAIRAVDKNVNVVLLPEHKAALISFVFNVGVGAFMSSTLLKVINVSDYGQVPVQLARWNKDHNGRVVQGLVNRRQAEIDLWNSAGS